MLRQNSKIKKNALMVLFSASICLNILVLVFQFPISKMLKEIIINKNEQSIFFITGIDNLIQQIKPSGNLFLKFEGFKSPDGQGWGSPEDAASIMYFRIAYLLYPYKVFTAPAGSKIVRGTEFLDLNFSPSDDWLRKMKITSILTFFRDEKGQIRWDYENFDQNLEK